MISDDEKALFRQSMRGVKPLKKNVHHIPNTPAPRVLPPPQKTIPPLSSSIKPLLSHYSPAYHPPVGPETILSWHKPHMPKNRLLALKKGNIPWDAQLDLHGLTQEDAFNTLCQFITTCRYHQHRSVLIIHGKGARLTEAPILKNQLYHWLQQLPEVLAFHSTQPRHGGAGALYVLLRW